MRKIRRLKRKFEKFFATPIGTAIAGLFLLLLYVLLMFYLWAIIGVGSLVVPAMIVITAALLLIQGKRRRNKKNKANFKKGSPGDL